MTPTKKIRVELGDRSYDIQVGSDLLSRLGEQVAPLARGGRAVIITDGNVGPLYAQQAHESIRRAGCVCDVITFPAGERNKSLRTYEQVVNELLSLSPAIDRRCLVVALGGGVAGDLAGFVAATALRGLNFVNVPTTLLADVDASVGGKTGLDTPAGKNLIGAFHQPRAVIIDSAAFKTLPPGELQNGLAECVKHAVIADSTLLDHIEKNAAAILALDQDVLAELIARNVAIKAEVVSADERESGRRAHLNFGHTIGHAIETAAGYGVLSHGQAVALGMTAACWIAVARKLVPTELAGRICGVLTTLALPVRFADLPDLPPAARQPRRLIEITQHDKKARAGVARFVLPTLAGGVAVFDDVTAAEILDAIGALERTTP